MDPQEFEMRPRNEYGDPEIGYPGDRMELFVAILLIVIFGALLWYKAFHPF